MFNEGAAAGGHQESVVPMMPMPRRREGRMSWSTGSNAADETSKTKRAERGEPKNELILGLHDRQWRGHF